MIYKLHVPVIPKDFKPGIHWSGSGSGITSIRHINTDGLYVHNMDYADLDLLRQRHPAWRLLCADNAPLIASFLHHVFIYPNVRGLAQSELIEKLDDELFDLRDRLGADSFPKPALEYLNDWAANEKGWLRKFYPQGSDEPHFDLTPAAEKAITWLGTLAERSFVGTESRLLTLFTLLRQMNEGSETDPEVRLAELSKRRDEIDAEMARIQKGDIDTLSDTALKDRFQQFIALAKELLSDFREVEHNFRSLDRNVRERIALWSGGKGALLEEIMGERDAIEESDQGRSFRAFWDFLLSTSRQDEFSELLTRVLALPPVGELRPDNRIGSIHYDWLAAGEHAQRTVAQLSQQLRRFLDDQAWLEDRRIMEILRGIEAGALHLRDTSPTGYFMEIDGIGADIVLPMERPLHTPPVSVSIADTALTEGSQDVDASALFNEVIIDKSEMLGRINRALQERPETTLRELVEIHPLNHGLAELIVYLQMASDVVGSKETFKAVIDEDTSDIIRWRSTGPDGETSIKQAKLPRVVFRRG